MIDEKSDIKAISSITFKAIEEKFQIRNLDKCLPNCSEIEVWEYKSINYADNHQDNPVSLYFRCK